MIAPLLEHLIAAGPEAMRHAMTSRMKIAMSLQCEPYRGAGHEERDLARRGSANGSTSKRVDIPAGTLHRDGPETARAPEPFFLQSLERGRWF
jgi:hypothetical protein